MFSDFSDFSHFWQGILLYWMAASPTGPDSLLRFRASRVASQFKLPASQYSKIPFFKVPKVTKNLKNLKKTKQNLCFYKVLHSKNM